MTSVVSNLDKKYHVLLYICCLLLITNMQRNLEKTNDKRMILYPILYTTVYVLVSVLIQSVVNVHDCSNVLY